MSILRGRSWFLNTICHVKEPGLLKEMMSSREHSGDAGTPSLARQKESAED